MIREIKDFLLYLWQLPQNFCGLVYSLFHKGALIKEYEDSIVYRSEKMHGGVSLGKYIFVNKFSGMKMVKHEYGHCVQSKKWGWLYLPVIGLSSGIWYILKNKGYFKDKSYFSFWTERRADELGGVIR